MTVKENGSILNHELLKSYFKNELLLQAVKMRAKWKLQGCNLFLPKSAHAMTHLYLSVSRRFDSTPQGLWCKHHFEQFFLSAAAEGFGGWGSLEMSSVFPAVMNTSGVMTDLVWLHGLWPILPLPLPVLHRNSKCGDALPSASATAAAQCSREQSMLFNGTLGFESLSPITNILDFCFHSMLVLFHCQSAWDVYGGSKKGSVVT